MLNNNHLASPLTVCVITGSRSEYGLMRWLMEAMLKRQNASEEERTRAGNVGILLSSGFIAGESLMAVILAVLVIGRDKFPFLDLPPLVSDPSAWPGLIILAISIYLLCFMPLSAMKKSGLPSTHIE